MISYYLAIIVIYSFSYILVAFGVHFLVILMLRQYQVPERGLKRAGVVIGILERIFVLTLVLIGQYATIAIIFTAKSIPRLLDIIFERFMQFRVLEVLNINVVK